MHLDSSACSDLQSASHVRAISPHPVLRSTQPSRYVCDEYVRLKYIDNSSIPRSRCGLRPHPDHFHRHRGGHAVYVKAEADMFWVSDQETAGAGWRRWSTKGVQGPYGYSAAVGSASFSENRSDKIGHISFGVKQTKIPVREICTPGLTRRGLKTSLRFG
jgi:hypothetical protein